MRIFKIIITFMVLLTLSSAPTTAGDLVSDVKIDVQSFRLENGMLFLVVERPSMPQVACRIAIRAGSALEQTAKTGIAHMLEHMMFKGTRNFGTLDSRKDEALQARIETAYQTILQEKQKRRPDQGLIEANLEKMAALRAEVQQIYVPQAFSSQLGKNGAVGVNAFTSKDQTQYIMSIPSDMIEQWFSIASEQLFEPSWREFYVEKDIVQREWAFRYVNNPNGAAWLDLEANAYQAHPYRNPVIGWKSDMENFTTEDAKAFHRAYYNPTNAVGVLVGNITVADARRLADIYFGRYPAGNRTPEKVTAEPAQQGPRKSIRFLKGARSPLIRIGFHTAPMGSADFYALDALTMILSKGRGARLTQHIVNQGQAVSAWAYNPDNRYGGMVVLGGSPVETQSDRHLDENQQRQVYIDACESLEKRLLAEIEVLKNKPVSFEALDRIKTMNRYEFLSQLQSNEHLAGTLATLEVQVGWRYLTTYLDHIAAVTPDDILRVAKRYFEENNRTSIYVIPGGTPTRPPENYTEIRSIGGASAATLRRPESFDNHSHYPTPAGWKHPLSFERRPEKIEYPDANRFTVKGAPVFYLSDSELPLIHLTILVKAGAVDVDRHKTGLDQLLGAAMIRGGSMRYSPSELAIELDRHAIQMSVSVRKEETVIKLSAMKTQWEKGLALLEEVLVRPRFDEQVLAVLKQQALVQLKRQGEDAQNVAAREAMIRHFKGHPYGRDPLIGLETIPSISRKDLDAFISTYFVPDNMVVTVAGDISEQAVRSDLNSLFARYDDTTEPARFINPPAKPSPMVTLIHKPGQVQAQVSLMLPTVKRTHPDYWKINLLTAIFGGGDSLVYKRLRDDLGLVYSTGFYQGFRWEAGFIKGYIGNRSDKTRQAITETVHIMQALQTEIPESRFTLKKLDILNSFVFNVDTPTQLVNVYGRYLLRDEPLDTLEKIQETFIRTSRYELTTLADRFLDPKKLQIVVVADMTTPVRSEDGTTVTLAQDIEAMAIELGLPFETADLR